MIYDKIENWKLYFKKPIFNNIFNDLKEFDINSQNGIYKKNGYYFKVMTYKTKLDPDIIESHKREVDIQIVLSGNEEIKIYDIDSVNIIKDYVKEVDCEFYKSIKPPFLNLLLKVGYMAVFFSDDIHQPQFATNNKIQSLKKIVIKIDEKFFS